MDKKILENFKTKNYEALGIDGRKQAILALINSISQENGLTSCRIEFGEGFSFDRRTNILTLDEENLENEAPQANYTMLTGIIHELRHKYQFDKGIDNDGLVYQGTLYAISPVEIDAHQYATRELIQLSDFFDDNEFDKYVYVLLNNDALDINEVRRDYALSGYKGRELDERAKEYAMFASGYISTTPGKDYAIKDGKTIDVNSLGYMEMIDLLSSEDKYIYQQTEEGILKRRLSNTVMFVNKENAYCTNLLRLSGSHIDVSKLASELLSEIDLAREYGLANITTINLPPIAFSKTKQGQEELYSALGVEDGKLSVENLRKLVEDEKLKGVQIFDELGVSDEEKYLVSILGLDYKEKYSEEQQRFLITTEQYHEDKQAARFLGEEDEKHPDGYFAPAEFKPEYSLEKFKLILAAQKRGLNTMHYGKLSEPQIQELMLAQLEGVPRQGLLKIVNAAPEDAQHVRKQVVGRNRKYESFEITDDCEIEVVPDKSQSLDD